MKIRCSAIGKILTDPRSKSEVLSETTKTYLREMWVEETFSRSKDIATPAIQKGLLVEEDGITMLAMHLKDFIAKNTKRFEDDYFTGTPDVIYRGAVYDIKSSWDIFSHVKNVSEKLNPDYEAQLNGYMRLTGCEKAYLVYCLIDTPEELILSEAKRVAYKLNDMNSLDDIFKLFKKQLTYSDIKEEDRIRIIEVPKKPELLEKAISRFDDCKKYYESLKL